MKKKVFLFTFLTTLWIVFAFSLTFTLAQSYSSIEPGFQFTRNLGLGNQGQDVENLQCVLEMTQTTGYFGPITKAAVLAFQNAHAAEILTPSGLTTGTGYFGLATRNYMNVQLHNSTSTNPICPTYTATTPDVPQYIPPQTLPTQPTTPTTPPNTVQCPNGYSCVQTPTQNQNQQGLLPTTPSFGQNGGLSGGNVSGSGGGQYQQPQQQCNGSEDNFYATHGGRNELTEAAWQSCAYNQQTQNPPTTNAPPPPTQNQTQQQVPVCSANTSNKFFALGDSIAQQYETGQPYKANFVNGSYVAREINDLAGYNKGGASPSTIANFASHLTSDQINYIKTYGIIIFSGTNNPPQTMDVKTTVQYLVIERGISPKQIFLSNILNSVSGSNTFNAAIASFAGQDIGGKGKIHLVDIQNLPSSDHTHPNIDPFNHAIQQIRSSNPCV